MTRREIALTLDDGYRPDGRLLDFLESNHLHGTAFIVGAVADRDPGFVRRVASLGWMVCSHTYDHKILPHLAEWEIRREIVRGADAVARVVGYRCPYFRAPGGDLDARVVAQTDNLGLRIVGWNASVADSTPGMTPPTQIDIAFHYLRPGSILLGHWGGVNSYVVLRAVIERLLASGYRIGSVDELLRGDLASPSAGPSASPTTFVPSASPRSVVVAVHRASWLRRTATVGHIATSVVVVAVLAAVAGLARRRRRIMRKRRLRSPIVVLPPARSRQ